MAFGLGLVWAVARLPHDCGCQTHSGPHWLVYDLDWRESNADLLWPSLSLAGFAAEEADRLRDLGREMEIHGVDSLRTLLGSRPSGGAA